MSERQILSLGDSDKPLCDPTELTALMQAGDLEALDRLSRCYGERLLAVGRRRCGDEDRARDAVQDALLAAGENLKAFRGEGSVEGWLVRMVANACHRMRRGRKNDPKLHGELSLELTEGITPEDDVVRTQMAEALGQALLSLDSRDRTLLLLGEGQDWRGPELAAALSMTPAAVRTRLSRIRKRMRELLGPLWSEFAPVEPV